MANTDQQPIQLGDKKVLLVKVPVGAEIYGGISNRQFKYMYRDKQGCMNYAASGIPLLPSNDYSILGTGTADKVTEVEAGSILIGEWDGMDDCYYYMDYKHQWNPSYYPEHWSLSAKESLLSLLASHNLKPEETVILVKQ